MKRRDPVGDKERLGHILESIEGIEELLIMDKRSNIHERALERYFEIIGEACKKVSVELKAQYPLIPWNKITGLRHIVIHDYDIVEINTLWEFAEHKIPALKDWIMGILEKHK